MANTWNQQEQGAKRKRTNQGTRGATRTQPAASNPNKNTKSTDTNRNSGRTAAAKPAPKAAPKAAPKQTKPKTVYYSNKNKGVKGAGQAAANAIAKNPRAQAAAKDTAGRARVRLANQTGAQRFVTGRDIPTVMNKPKTFQQTVTPLEQVKADSLTGPRYWTSRATVPSKPLTAEQQKKKNQQTAKQSGFNARARKQTLSSHDQKLSQGKQFQIQQAKQRYDEAKAKGDRAGMEKAHREAENLRYTAGYSGGATGNERIAPKLSQDDYNRLNASGQLAMKQARMTRDRATTEDEIARADRRIEEILNAPGYRNNRLSAAETGKGWSYGPDGRRMWSGTKEQNRADAAPGLAALRSVGEGAAGGLLYAGQTASRATRDKFERENIDKWIADEANYNQAKSDLEFIRSYKEQFGVVPDGYNEMQAQIAYNNAVQARAQLQRIRGDVDSLYFDPTVAERLGLPTTRDETLGEHLLRQAAEDQAKATEGMNGVERFVTNALISTGQSVPGMALGLIPGVGPALGLGVLGAQAGGSRAYDLRQQGVTAEDAYRAGFISGGIEALTEKLPLENFAQIIKSKNGKSALRNILEQAGLEGSEEAVSYVGNYIADVAQHNPDAHFSWLELLENAGMGAIGGAAFGVVGGFLSPGHAVSPMGAQSEEIQEQARNAAAQVEAVQDAETQIRTVAAQRLREDAQAYNEMVKAGVWSDAEKEMVKASLDQRYAEIAGQNAGQTSPVANQAPLTQVFEDGMQMNRAMAERAPAASAPTPLTVNETPASVDPVEQAERMTAEALRATDAEMARRDAVAQLQAETPPITYERSGLPPTSFLGAAIDARREARARAEAEAKVRRDQEIARQNRVAAEQQTVSANEPTEIGTSVLQNEQVQAQPPVSRLEGLASTFGESGAASLRTIGGKMLTGQGAFVRDFTDVYNQVLGGRSESQVSRPAGMSDANYFAAVTAAQNDRQTGWDLDILKASKAAGRNVNAGVDWRDQYVRQMDRKTARTVDGLAKALGVKVVFAEKGSILTAGGTAANAEITGNVVRIEKGNPNPVRMLIGHELTHRMQDISPENYRAFRDYAMSMPGSMEALERTVSLYQRAGAFRAQDNARQMAMDEVTADFAGSLLENSEQLQEFIRRNYENRTMLEVIRDFFRDLAAKLTGRERAQADEAVRLLEEAIKGASKRVKDAGLPMKTYKAGDREDRLNKVNAVKGARFSITPQADADYLSAVERGDMETAQRMVDEAAKAAGYTIKAYHGTPNGTFHVFRDWSYFTEDRDYADVYQNQGASSNGYKQTEDNPKTYGVYLEPKNAFDTRTARDRKIFQNEFYRQWGNGAPLSERGLPDWTDGDDLIEFFDEEGYDYDAFYLDEGGTGGYGDEVHDRGVSIVIKDSAQVKSADPVTYDDDGNVIPLSERFNAENQDIRYSLGTEGYDRARLMRENQELKEKLEYWRGQVKKSDRTKADPKEVRKLAKSLRTDYSTEMDAGEITQRLQAIYDGIGKDWSYDRAYDEAGKLARDMIEQATATEDYLYAEYEPMRKFFQDTPLVVTKEMQRAIPDYNEWRKPLFGKLRLQGGEQTNVDQVFQEAVERWPEFFNEEVSSHSLDQLDRIVEVLDNVYRREEINPFEDDMSAPAGYLATEIMDMFWDVPAVKKTFADRMQNRLNRQIEKTNQAKEQGRERVQKVREQRDRAIAKLRADHKEKYEKALQRARDQREQALKKQSERYLTAKKKRSQQQKERELRAKIQRHVKKLSTKLTRPTDTQYIPEVLMDTVRTALESINLSSGFTVVQLPNGKTKRVKDGSGEKTSRTQAFAALQKMYQEMDTNGSEVVIDPDLIPNISDIIGFADTPIANLGMEDLNTIWQTVRAIEASISTFNKALGRAKFETISQPAFGIRDYLTGRKDRGDYRGPFRQMDKLLNFNMLTPEAYFLRMGNSGKEVFRMLRDAQDRHITIMDQAQRKTREIVGKTDIRKLEKEKHTFTFDGETVELTTAQIMSLYELMKRQQAVDHVMIGGIRPESVKKGIKDLPPARPWHLTQDQVSAIVDSLTEEQVKLADEMQKYMGGTMAELGNEASMEVYGYRKFTEKHYFPISVDKNQTQSDVKNDAVSGTIAGWGSARPVKPNANNAVILRSIFDVYADHTTEMANYASWLAPMENMNRIFNFRYKDAEGNQTGTMKDQLETLFGKNGEAYWKQLQNDLNNGVHGRDDSPFSAFMGTYKASAIGANIRVIAQQPTAILRAMDSINPADFVAGMARARWGKFDKVVKQYAPIAIWKDWGYFQQDTGRQMRNVLFNDDTKLQKANSAMMWGAGKADSLSWTAIWNALESETRRKRKDLRYKSREFYEAVAERFNEVVDHTQVVDGILQRSQIMRSADGLTKMATSFMAEPTKTYNMMLSAIYEARNAKGRERSAAMGKLAKTAFALTVSITVNAAAQSLVDAIRDDDKDEDYWEKFIQAYFGLEGDTRKEQIKNGILNGNLEAAFNPLTYIPYLKDIVSQTQGYSVSRMDMDTISRVLKAFTNVEKAMSGEGKNTKQSAWLNLTAEIARFLGVPAANIKRDVQTILRTFFAGTGNYRMLYEQEKFLYDVTSKNTLTEFSKLILGAERAGDEEAAQAIRQDMIDSGVDAEKIDKKLAELRKKAVTETEEYQTALAQKTDAYNTMLEASDQFQAFTEDQKTKARGMVEDYAEWQAYGDQVALGEKDQAAYDKIREAEAHDIPATDWIVFTTAASDLKADYKEDGTRIDGSKKEKVLKLIDSYDIPNEGKSYMYLSQGYSEKDNPYQ